MVSRMLNQRMLPKKTSVASDTAVIGLTTTDNQRKKPISLESKP